MGARHSKALDASLFQPKSLAAPEMVDLKKLKRLIQARRLAPCWPQDESEDGRADGREECPICNYWYPALNSASCCAARICTECFVSCQTSTDPPGAALCPYCKQGPFAVQFLGSKSEEQLQQEKRESKAVFEAKRRVLLHEEQWWQQQQRRQQQDAAAQAGQPPQHHDHHDHHDHHHLQPHRPPPGALTHDRSQPAHAALAAAATQAGSPPHPHSGLIGAAGPDRRHPGAQNEGAQPEQQHQPQQLGAGEQQEPGAEALAEELFVLQLLPAYVRRELAGLSLDEIEEILVEQALIASLGQAAAAAGLVSQVPAWAQHAAIARLSVGARAEAA